jgi:hypothetical protein
MQFFRKPVLCAPFHACQRSKRCRLLTHKHSKDYNGSRWQPSSPRPPQLLRGVSCICNDSDGPPEALGRSTFTVNGICALLAPTFHPSDSMSCRSAPSRTFRACQQSARDNSLLHFAIQLLPPEPACRGSSSPPSQTWLCYRPPSTLPSPLDFLKRHC